METPEKKSSKIQYVLLFGAFVLGVLLGAKAIFAYVKYKLNSDKAFEFITSFLPPSEKTQENEKEKTAA